MKGLTYKVEVGAEEEVVLLHLRLILGVPCACRQNCEENRMHLSRLFVCLGSVGVAALLYLPQAALYAAPATPAPAVPTPAGALSPVEGAKQALERGRLAKGLPQLNGVITNESAATIGFSLVLMDSLVSGISSGLTKTLTPKTATQDNAAEKAYQDKAEALLKRYSLDAKTIDASNKSGALPPALVAHGHEFFSEAQALDDAYDKSHAADGITKVTQSGKEMFPAPAACSFQVLSPTRVKIVPQDTHKDPIEARLEDGQWRLDLEGMGHSSPASKIKTITPQAAAFLKDIDDNDVDAVARKLKANPSLANSPEAFIHGDTGGLSEPPLLRVGFVNNPQIAALLVRYGANVNAENSFGDTPLSQAARFGAKGVVAILLAHGAKVNHKDGEGRTALHSAVQSDDPATVALLLTRGADTNARDEAGKTPLALAADSRSDHSADHAAILKLLRQHGGR